MEREGMLFTRAGLQAIIHAPPSGQSDMRLEFVNNLRATPPAQDIHEGSEKIVASVW
jgi:hypothetical protein